MDHPRTIHDCSGFPEELYKVHYPALGSPELAKEASRLVTNTSVILDQDWGLDHCAWTVIRHKYPEANIPVLQLSIHATKGHQYHYDLSRELLGLRKKGVLILGSGNMVHNLRMMSWNILSEPDYGYDWAKQINQTFKDLISSHNHDLLINYEKLGKEAMQAIPTPDDYWPLLYILGLQKGKDEVSFFNDHAVGGSMTMTSVLLNPM